MYKLFLLIFFCLSCNIPEPKQIAPTEKEVIQYDSLIIDLDAVLLKKQQRNEWYKNLTDAALIDSIINLGAHNGIAALKDSDKLFGNYRQMGKYYRQNIPTTLYKKLFPKEEIIIHKERIAEVSTDEAKKLVTIRKGKEVKEERQYKYLYAVNKKEKFLQLIFTSMGKFSPELTLFTMDIENLKIIDELKILGGIYDSYDIDYWHSTFSENHEGIVITHVKNLKFDDIELDTTITHYKFSEHGKILRQQ